MESPNADSSSDSTKERLIVKRSAHLARGGRYEFDHPEQAHALGVTLNDQAITVVLDLVDPFRAIGNLRSLGRDQGSNGIWVCRLLGSLSSDVSLVLPHVMSALPRILLQKSFRGGERKC